MEINEIYNNLFQTVPYVIVKIFAVVALLLHLAFSFLIIKQTKLMNKIVETTEGNIVYFFSLVHLLMSVFILIFTIIFL